VWRRIQRLGSPLPYFTRESLKKRRSAATRWCPSHSALTAHASTQACCLNWAAGASYMGVANRRTRVPCGRTNPASITSSSILTRAEQTASGSERICTSVATNTVTGQPHEVRSWPFGGCKTRFDTEVKAIAVVVNFIRLRYASSHPTPSVIYLILVVPNDSPIRAVMNPHSRGSHDSALTFHRSLTAIFDTHEHVRHVGSF